MNSQSQYFMFHNAAERPLLNMPTVSHIATAGPSQQHWNDWYRNCVAPEHGPTSFSFPNSGSDRTHPFLLPNFCGNFPQQSASGCLLPQAGKETVSICPPSLSNPPFHTQTNHVHGLNASRQLPGPDLVNRSVDGHNFNVGQILNSGGQPVRNVYFADDGHPVRVIGQSALPPALATNQYTTNFYTGQPFAYRTLADHKGCTIATQQQQSTVVSGGHHAAINRIAQVNHVHPQPVATRYSGGFDMTKDDSMTQGQSTFVYQHQQSPTVAQPYTKAQYCQLPDSRSAIVYNNNNVAPAGSQFALQNHCQQFVDYSSSTSSGAAATQMCMSYTDQQYDCEQIVAMQNSYQEHSAQSDCVTLTPPLLHKVNSGDVVKVKRKENQQQKQKDREIAEVDKALDRHLNLLASVSEHVERPSKHVSHQQSVENLKAPFLLPSARKEPIKVQPAVSLSPVQFVSALLSPGDEDLVGAIWTDDTVCHLYLKDPSTVESIDSGAQSLSKGGSHVSKVPVYKQRHASTDSVIQLKKMMEDGNSTESPYNFTDEDLESSKKPSPSGTSLTVGGQQTTHRSIASPQPKPLPNNRDSQIDVEVMQNLFNISNLHPELRNAVISSPSHLQEVIQPRLVLRIPKERLCTCNETNDSERTANQKNQKRCRERKEAAMCTMVNSAATGRFSNSDCKGDNLSDSGIICDSKGQSPAYGTTNVEPVVPIAGTHFCNAVDGIISDSSRNPVPMSGGRQLLSESCYGSAYGMIMNAEH